MSRQMTPERHLIEKADYERRRQAATDAELRSIERMNRTRSKPVEENHATRRALRARRPRPDRILFRGGRSAEKSTKYVRSWQSL